MSRRNSRDGKALRRYYREDNRAAQPRRLAAGICRAGCDPRHRTLIRPERLCVPCFDKLAFSLSTLPGIFGA